MKAIVTGGAGFIGSHVVDALIERGIDVFIIDNLSSGNKKNINPRAKFTKIDINDKKILGIFEKIMPDALFHLAAQIDVRRSVMDPAEDAHINILGAIQLLEASKQVGLKKIIFSSSGGAIYGDTENIPTPETHTARPISPYGIAKLTCEHYLHYYKEVFGIDYVALRYANVYGPRQNSQGEAGVVAVFCNKMIYGEQPVIYGDGKQTRDYTYVGDIVEANILAMQSEKVGAYNIGTGIETDVNALSRMIKDRLLYKDEIIHGKEKKGEVKRSCLDYSLAKKVLGWEPKVQLEDGIRKTVEWFRDSK